MSFKIPLSPSDVGEQEQQYVLEAMKSGRVAPAGPDLDAFDRGVAERVGAAYAAHQHDRRLVGPDLRERTLSCGSGMSDDVFARGRRRRKVTVL